ncbi:sugar phosphate isomerase/epimerase [Thiomicrorhabdus sp. Kp2]|uniref:sugar phosphate isomerase/epimerase n=1 Tax=Thiomicrorhabdus sp. Kp2 TaxID=1123518 RepID=UPI001E62C5CE|nr:sugar phosphate isomerase/epimerase [Thiomicrorhabdus sp. Kp2]
MAIDSMQLKTFKTLWGNTLPIDQACQDAIQKGFSGIEGQAPQQRIEQAKWHNTLQETQCNYIAEIVTGGDYVPNRNWSENQHLDDIKRQLDDSMPLNPLFATCITGCDAWEESQSIKFFEQAMQIGQDYGIDVCFETHRSRSLFNPWITRKVVKVLPEIKLTLDISHWCVVCERLMDTEMDVIHAIKSNVHHIHARVGYDQGPQVPHPAAPEYAKALKSHQRVWETVWQAQFAKGFAVTTLTPEFGPDGYLHLQPFTQMPVADLSEINQWMNQIEQQQFLEVFL